MAPPTDAEKELYAHKLVGKINYFNWRRYSDRAHKIKGTWNLLTGEEPVRPEPKMKDYFIYAPATPPSTPTEGDTAETTANNKKEARGPFDSNLTLAGWQIGVKKWEAQQERVQLAKEIILNSVSPSIATELQDEDMNTPNLMARYIRQIYGVTDEFARQRLLDDVRKLKLSNCKNMTDYLNQHRELRLDLVRAKMTTYDDSVLASNILNGLPETYASFREKWDWDRAREPDAAPDMHFLSSRLLTMEEDIRLRAPKPKKNSDLDKNKGGRQNSNLVCTYAKCGRKGHDEDHCFVKHPDQKPDWYKEKEAEWAAKQKEKGTADKAGPSKDTAADSKKTSGKKVFTAAAIFEHGDFSRVIHDAFDAAYPSPPVGRTRLFTSTAFASSIRDAFILAKFPDLSDDPLTSIRRLFASPPRSIDIEPFLPSIRYLFCERTLYFPSLGDPPLSAFAATKGAQVDRSTVLLDSGANGHIFNDRRFFTKFASLSYDISTAGGASSLHVEGGGDVSLDFEGDDGSFFTFILSEVAYCPDAYCNLVSLSLLANKANLHGEWDARGVTLRSADGDFLTTAVQSNGLFILDPLAPAQIHRPTAALTDFNHPVWEWHRRLGHLGWQSMLDLVKVSTGIPLTAAQIKPFLHEICPICAVTKALVKIPRDPATRRSSDKGQLLHVDQWGPYPVEGHDGTRYALFMTDDFTRYTWIESYSRPEQMPAAFKALHKNIEKTHNCVIRGYRFDGQFQVGEVANWVQRKHLHIEPTPAYHHYAAGVEERVHRTVREKASPMMQEVQIAGHLKDIIAGSTHELLRGTTMPERLWPLALGYATWLKNRAPTRALRDKITPWEALFGVTPHFQRESIWGSRVFVTLPPEQGRDRAPKIHGTRGWVGSFVGCFSESIYQIWNEDKHRVFHIGVARVQQGVGLDDPRDGDSYDDRNSASDDHDHSNSPDDDVDDPILFSENDIPLDELEPVQIIDDDFADPDHPWWLHSDEEIDLEDDPFQQGEFDNQSTSTPYQLQQVNVSQDDLSVNPLDQDDSPLQEESAHQSTPYRLQHNDIAQDDLSPQPEEMELKSRFFAFAIDKTTFPKCGYCFKNQTTCDGNRPCQTCRRRGGRCANVTNDQLLEFPARAQTVIQKAKALESSTLLVMDPKCRLCLQLGITCRTHPGEDDCVACTTKGKTCNWDLTNAKPKRKTGNTLVRNSAAVPITEACAPCRKANTNCDGGHPCSRCSRLSIQCVPQEDKSAPKCLRCESGKFSCDRGRPCKTCLAKGTLCSYLEQEGLVLRQYNLNLHRRKNGWPEITEALEECSNCTKMHPGRCHQDQPCYQCVLDVTRGLAGAPSTCIYRFPENGGMAECWFLACWTLGAAVDEYSDPPVVLEENWKNILQEEWDRRYRQPRKDRIFGAQTVHPQPSTIREFSPERSQELEWRTQFQSDFPHGAVEVPTSGVGRLCAWHALRHSIEHQIPGVRSPDVDDLQAIYNRLAGENPEFEMGNSDTFRLDQLILTAQTYLAQYGVRRRIGLVYPHKGQRFFAYIYSQSDHLSNEGVLWIYNDNHSAQSWRDAHFWGLRHRTPAEQRLQEELRLDDPDDSDRSSGDEDPDIQRRMRKPHVDDDVAEFIEQGSMRKDASRSSRTQARTVMLAALANVLSNPDQKTLEDYDAEDGPDPARTLKPCACLTLKGGKVPSTAKSNPSERMMSSNSFPAPNCRLESVSSPARLSSSARSVLNPRRKRTGASTRLGSSRKASNRRKALITKRPLPLSSSPPRTGPLLPSLLPWDGLFISWTSRLLFSTVSWTS